MKQFQYPCHLNLEFGNAVQCNLRFCGQNFQQKAEGDIESNQKHVNIIANILPAVKSNTCRIQKF